MREASPNRTALCPTSLKGVFAVLFAALLVMVPLTGCVEDQGPAEEAGEAVDEFMDETQDAAEEVMEDIEDAIDDSEGELEEAAEEAGDAMEEGAEEVEEAVEGDGGPA